MAICSGDGAVALAHAHGVYQHHVFVAQAGQHAVQVGRVLHRMHRHAEDLAVDAQLLVSAYAVAVGGDQGQLVGAEAHHAARRELGGGGGLADAGRPHQRIHAALVHQRVLVFQQRHAPRELGLRIVHALPRGSGPWAGPAGRPWPGAR
jgi:hypothetical protein